MTFLDKLANSGPLLWGLAALLGACFGSFMTLLVHRLPRDEPVVATRSHCPKCLTPLSWKDLFPIFSYLLAGAKCRYCKAPISPRYVLLEIGMALLFVILLWAYGLTWQTVILALLAVCLVTMIIIDFGHYIIPDQLQIAMIVLGVLYIFAMEREFDVYATGAFVGLAIGLALRYGFLWLRNKDALGMGDVKFLFVVGLWIGAKPLVPFLFLSGILGIVTSVLWRALKQGAVFPFGPALAVAMVICLLWPQVPALFWETDRWLTFLR